MENEQNQIVEQKSFFSFKTNGILLLILIVLMVIAIVIMLGDKQKYFSFLKGNKEVQIEIQTEEQREAADDFYAQDSHYKERFPSRYSCVGEYCDGSMNGDDPSMRTVLQIPLVTQGGTVGCGAKIFYAPHATAKTSAVLDATYKLLFDIKTEPEIKADGFRNTLGGYTKLFYDSVAIKDGTAKLYLTGSMSSSGVCADPEVRAQINAAAFYFDSVKKIEVYLNGKLYDWCEADLAGPEVSHCDTTPRYWIDTKK
jgi:hypothetical protein